MSYGNLEGTDQGNVKVLFEDNVQGIAAGVIERGDCIKRPFHRAGFRFN